MFTVWFDDPYFRSIDLTIETFSGLLFVFFVTLSDNSILLLVQFWGIIPVVDFIADFNYKI